MGESSSENCHTFRWQISVVYRFARAPPSSEKTATVLDTTSAAVLFSHDFSDSPLPPNLVLQQCKYTHQARENQRSKSYWSSPAQSTQTPISPSLIQSGWRLVPWPFHSEAFNSHREKFRNCIYIAFLWPALSAQRSSAWLWEQHDLMTPDLEEKGHIIPKALYTYFGGFPA